MKDILNKSVLVKEYAVVKEKDSSKTEINDVGHLLDNVTEDCRKNIFIRLCIDVFRILYLQLLKLMKKVS